MKNNKVFMAIKVGKESVEGSFKMYKGIAALKILAVTQIENNYQNSQAGPLRMNLSMSQKMMRGKRQLR